MENPVTVTKRVSVEICQRTNVKIGLHLPKLWSKVKCIVFFETQCILWMMLTELGPKSRHSRVTICRAAGADLWNNFTTQSTVHVSGHDSTQVLLLLIPLRRTWRLLSKLSRRHKMSYYVASLWACVPPEAHVCTYMVAFHPTAAITRWLTL